MKNTVTFCFFSSLTTAAKLCPDEKDEEGSLRQNVLIVNWLIEHSFLPPLPCIILPFTSCFVISHILPHHVLLRVSRYFASRDLGYLAQVSKYYLLLSCRMNLFGCLITQEQRDL